MSFSITSIFIELSNNKFKKNSWFYFFLVTLPKEFIKNGHRLCGSYLITWWATEKLSRRLVFPNGISTHLSCSAMPMDTLCIKTFYSIWFVFCSFPFNENRFHIQFYNSGQNLLNFIGLVKWTWFLPNGFEMPIFHSVNHFTSNSNFLYAKNQNNEIIHFFGISRFFQLTFRRGFVDWT